VVQVILKLFVKTWNLRLSTGLVWFSCEPKVSVERVVACSVSLLSLPTRLLTPRWYTRAVGSPNIAVQFTCTRSGSLITTRIQAMRM
jgi:hypothetical protein